VIDRDGINGRHILFGLLELRIRRLKMVAHKVTAKALYSAEAVIQAGSTDLRELV
jgi:hypothetical protein